MCVQFHAEKNRINDKMERLDLRAPSEWVDLIDEWRSTAPGRPTRSAAIRMLAEIGLQSLQSKQKTPKK